MMKIEALPRGKSKNYGKLDGKPLQARELGPDQGAFSNTTGGRPGNI